LAPPSFYDGQNFNCLRPEKMEKSDEREKRGRRVMRERREGLRPRAMRGFGWK